MSEVHEVLVPHETVNDDFVLLAFWHVEDGMTVDQGQILAEMETSKAAFEITSPVSGIIRLLSTEGDDVPVGELICCIGNTSEAINSFLKAKQKKVPVENSKPVEIPEKINSHSKSAVPEKVISPTSDKSLSQPATTRFSQRALQLIRDRKLSIDEFKNRGLIRETDILAILNGYKDNGCNSTNLLHKPKTNIPTVQEPVQERNFVPEAPFKTKPVSRAKGFEAKILSWSQHEAISSTVNVQIATAGSEWFGDCYADFVEQRTAILIQKCGELLRQYPQFNAYSLGNENRFYDEVNIGYAIDLGSGLKVPVLKKVDSLTLDQIVSARREFIDQYLDSTFTPASFSECTFSISDLSGSEVSSFVPLISEGQSAILGVGAESGSAQSGYFYQLIMTFDHRIAEGRTSGQFLAHLGQRLQKFEEEYIAGMQRINSTLPICSRCSITSQQAAQRNHFLVQVASVAMHNSPTYVCTICLSGR